MEEGLASLRSLLDTRCDKERSYQELLESHPWMLPQYSAVQRHMSFDDKRIPDFTATRSTDGCLDIVELKQPFLELFRQDGEFAATFNDAWNQGEGYVGFAERQKSYLREEKGMRFENPTCLLVVGSNLTESQLQKLREKEMRVRGIKILTYDQLLRAADHALSVVRAAGESIPAVDYGPDGQEIADPSTDPGAT
jgi:hypothetical protein